MAGGSTFSQRHPFVMDAFVWIGCVVVLAALAAGARAIWGGAGVRTAPFDSTRMPRLRPGAVVAVGTAILVLAAVRSGVVERLRWRWLVVCGWLLATSWSVGLACARGRAGLTLPLRALLEQANEVDGHPGAFLRLWTDRSRLHLLPRSAPPGGPLFVAALRSCGLRDNTALAIVLTALGALVVPFVAIATRSLCHDRAGRRILPLLVLAPWEFAAGSAVARLAGTTAAAGIACAVVGSEPVRRLAARRFCAVAAGLLLGSTALLDYSAALLGGAVVAVYFVRRRPGLILLSAFCVLIPLGIAAHAGFGWSGGLSIARHDLRQLSYPHRPVVPWLVLDVLGLLLIGGPALVTACRGVKRTPGWPFLLGAAAALGFSIVADLTRNDVDRVWLPELPWLLVPVVAPLIRPADNDDPDAPDAGPAPIGLLAAGAVVALVLRFSLGTTY